MDEKRNDEVSSKLIRDYEKDERPREKALKYGINSLSDAELMALVFSTGIKGKSVIDLCQEILDYYNNSLLDLTKESIKSLCDHHKGIGLAKATTLLAGLTLGKRAARELDRIHASEATTTSMIAYHRMRHRLADLQHEEFWIVTINRGGKITNEFQISKGGTSATTVDVKIILKTALDHLASSIILFHNHPSGTLRPSVEDDRLTRKIVDAARMVDIMVHDHIIVTHGGYYSYADEGRM